MKRLAYLAAVLLPALLLYPAGQGFYRDWANHVWLVGYFGEYFHQHLSMPVVINTQDAPGMAYPVFYGALFYQVLGVVAAWLHPEIVLRLAALLLFALQFFMVRNTFRRWSASEGTAAAAGCLTVWAIYPLTNLYNRAAVPEFMAVGLLTCAVCAWFDLLDAEETGAVWRRAAMFVLLLTLAAGTHPITAVGGLAVAGLLLPPFFLGEARMPRRRHLLPLALAGLLGAVALGPWVYAVGMYGSKMQISDGLKSYTTLFYHPALDAWYTRVFPLPVDWRAILERPAEVSTPHLDAQINVPLLILCLPLAVSLLAGLSWQQRRWAACLLAPPALFGVVAFWLSIHPAGFRFVPKLFLSVQMVYRMVAYINLALLLLLLSLAVCARRLRPAATEGSLAASPVLLTLVLTLAGCGVVVKLLHGVCATVPHEELVDYWKPWGKTYTTWVGSPNLRASRVDPISRVELPLAFLGYDPYIMPAALPSLGADERQAAPFVPLDVEIGWRFGETADAVVSLPHDGYVATNVLPFPWCRPTVDGEPVDAGRLRSWADDRLGPWPAARLAVPVPAGEHRVGYGFVPDQVYRALRWLSATALLCWCGVLGLTALAALRKSRRPPTIVAAPSGSLGSLNRTTPGLPP